MRHGQSAVNPWVGSRPTRPSSPTCSRTKLGYTVEPQGPRRKRSSWQGFETGEVDAILEVWGHDGPGQDLHRREEGRPGRRPDGRQGHHRLVRARVGWPRTNPDITGLDTTSTSTPTCSRPPSRATRASSSLATRRTSRNDEALITNLGLNYKVVYWRQRGGLHQAIQAGDRPEDAAPGLLLRRRNGPGRRRGSSRPRPGQPAAVHGWLRRAIRRRWPATTRPTISTRPSRRASPRTAAPPTSWSRTSTGRTTTRAPWPSYIDNQGMTPRRCAAKNGSTTTRPSGPSGCRLSRPHAPTSVAAAGRTGLTDDLGAARLTAGRRPDRRRASRTMRRHA